jgi:hypothetical protein
MSDYFFYDLNKKMADLANKQQLAEDAQATPAKPAPNRLMEAAADYSAKKAAAGKDIGKPGKNFSKIAAGAAKRYGSEEAGKRVAGAVLNKLRHTEESIDQGQLKPWKATMKEGGKPDFLDLDKDGNRKEPMKSAARSAKKVVDESTCPSCKCSPCKCDSMDESALQAAFGKKKYGDQGMKALQKAGRDHAGAKTMSNIRNKYDKYDEGMMDEVDATPQHVDDWTPPAKPSPKASAPKPPVTPKPGPKKPAMYPPQAIDDPVKEGGVPMTPKQKKFAALAKPFDKISFADKIVGAKKEVDEMLGDVAANAMKSAVGKMRGRNRDMDESWIDDEPTRRRSSSGGEIDTSKPGVTRHTAVKGNYSGARHDVGADDEPSGAVGRRKVGAGMGKKIGAKINRGTSKLMTDEDMFEPRDPGEYDNEGGMAKDDIKTIVRHAQALEQILSDEDNLPEWVQSKLAKIEGMMTAVDDYMQNQQGDDMGDEMDEESTNKRDNRAERAGRKVAKDIEYDEKKKDGIHGKRRGSEDSKAERAGRKVTKDIEYDEKHKKNESSDQHFDKGYYDSMDAAKKDNPKSIVKARKQPFEEESTNTRDSRAERAGRKVAKDIEYDEKKKDGIHGKRRGSEDDKAERAGKKVTKDIEYDEKHKKKKEVDETTSSGSVATGAAPKSVGGMKVGTGIYDSLNRQLENMISESMNINMSMNNDEHGGPRQSLTVTATDEDAVMLAGLLKMAGMGTGDDHIHAMTGDDSGMDAIYDMDSMHGEEPCADCGSSPCGCDDQMMDEAYGDTDASENEPDWPTNQEGTDNAGMYSGGIDGPKRGQTTVPVISGQHDRMGYNGLREDDESGAHGRDVEKILSAIKKLLIPNPNDPLGREKKPEGQTSNPPPANDKKDDSGEMSKLLKMFSKE